MLNTRLAPRFRIRLVLGTTAGLIVTALLALILVWGPRPLVETPSAVVPLGHPSQNKAYPGGTLALWLALSPSLVVPLKGSGSNGNQMVLALSSGAALALSMGVLWVARQRRVFGVPERDASGLKYQAKIPQTATL